MRLFAKRKKLVWGEKQETPLVPFRIRKFGFDHLLASLLIFGTLHGHDHLANWVEKGDCLQSEFGEGGGGYAHVHVLVRAVKGNICSYVQWRRPVQDQFITVLNKWRSLAVQDDSGSSSTLLKNLHLLKESPQDQPRCACVCVCE